MLRFKNKLCDKGFTLIELLGVIVLLAIIAIIALITVNRNIKNSQETLYKVQINNIKDGAKNWSTDNIKNIPDGETIYLTLAQLKQGGYVEENIKSPSDDKLCFPNDLQISIKSNESGSYEYNVENNDITYVSCENDTLDMTSPYIVLSKGDEVNGDNEVVDYVEIGQNGYDVPIATAFTSSGAVFSDINSSSFKIEKISYKDNSNNTGNLVQSDYQASLQNGILSLKINNITNIGRIYKIVYKLADGDKTVTAVRNVILQDTTPPEIVINKTEDIITYYKDSNNQLKFIPYIFPTTALSITDNGGNDNINYTVEGKKEINDYFNNLTDISNFSSKEFPIIITATDASGNSSKKSQNINFLLKEAKGPVVKLYNSKNELLYENHADSSDSSQNKSYADEWRSDVKFKLNIESGCPIDSASSYYIYNNNNDSTKIYFNSLNINNGYDISFDIDTIEGTKNLQVYTTCGNVNSEIYPNPTVQMESTTIKIDKTNPIVSSTSTSKTWADGSTKVTLTGIAQDTLSGLVAYQCSTSNSLTANSSGWTTFASTTSEVTKTCSKTPSTTTTYYIYFKDATGNVDKKSVTVNVDKVTPTVSAVAKKSGTTTTVSSGSWVNTNLTFTLSKGTVGGSGATIYYCIDSGTTNSCTPATKYTSALTLSSTSRVRYKIVSGAGKASSVANYQAAIDKTPPTITITKSNSYPSRNHFVTKVYGGHNGCWVQFLVYTGTSSTVAIGNVSSIDINHCSASWQGNGKCAYGTTAASSCSDTQGSSSYTGKGVTETLCYGTGSTYVRDSGISINLNQAYQVYEWYMRFSPNSSSSKYFTDFCSYNGSLSVSGYIKNTSYCSGITSNVTKTFASGSTASGTATLTGSFIESSIKNLSISYSDSASQIKTNGTSSVSNVVSNQSFTATDNAGNTASCTFNNGNNTCSCTSGTCSVR